MQPLRARILISAVVLPVWYAPLDGAELARAEVFSVAELDFQGPPQSPADAPARDIDFSVRFRLEQEEGAEITVHGFWDGGGVFRVRFTPTRPGRWTLAEVRSNAPMLNGQKQGDWVTASPSRQRGFWVVDQGSAGLRWYRRSDGSRQYIVGNTQYSFLSGYRAGGRPAGVGIAADVARNARYFKKLRFTLHGDRYPNPAEKPFLDDQGKPTDSGDYSHRPNPRWYSQRADVAVKAAFEHDLIADLILCGPDVEDARATLRARANNGDPRPYLKYIAARYGAFPNVWMCVCNEYNIRVPRWSEDEIAAFGRTLRGFLPYPTPVSVHPNSPTLWHANYDYTQPWYDHQIIQRKLRSMAAAADVLQSVWENRGGGSPRFKPTVNDELSYQGEGDNHNEGDTLEAHLGAFLGGGYGTTGYKPGNKLGHYFWGGFDPAEHTAAPGLQFLREAIDANVSFWNMAPGASIFPDLDADFRAMSWPGRQYVLGTNKARKGMVAELPPGAWTVKRFDIVAREETALASDASGRFVFDAPASRAVLFVFRRNTPPPAKPPLSRLRVSANRRFLETVEGKPFFWLGDTAWSLIQRASREDRIDQPSVLRYFANRAAKGFNVIQCRVAGDAASEDVYGRPAFLGRDFARPRILPGPDDDYWDTVDWFVAQAREHGIYLALLPIWAASVPNTDKLAEDPPTAYRYGHFLGRRYASQPHILWVLGGDAPKDRDVDNPKRMALTRAMAEGIADGVNGAGGFDGKADYSTSLMTYHPRGGGQSSSRLLHNEEWLDFNMIQTTSRRHFTNYEIVSQDYAKAPAKPTLDAEVAYEYSLPLQQREPQDRRVSAWDVRKAAYWNVLSGAFGHTYGHRSYISWSRHSEQLRWGNDIPWHQSLDAPGSFHVSYLKKLMESRPFLTRIPDQAVIARSPGDGMERAAATRDSAGSYAMVYLPTGNPAIVRTGMLQGKEITAWWFNPREGSTRRIGRFPAGGVLEFVPPLRGEDNDWVLVIDSAAAGYAAPGQ